MICCRIPKSRQVRLADLHFDHLPPFLKPLSGRRLIPTPLDVRDREAVLALMRECDAVMSAIPYYFNLQLAECAVEAGVHFCDLGGNTEIVFQQKAAGRARPRRRGSPIVPDCGVAPGMVNILAQHGIEQLDTVDSVRIYVGGLPQKPEPPLNYQIVYSLEGVLDYYTTLSWVVRDGKREQVDGAVRARAGRVPASRWATLEAFHTAGGLSTMAFRYEGKIPTMEYKTLRYPGPRRDHGDHPRARPAGPGAGGREGHEGGAARPVRQRRRPEAHEARGQGPARAARHGERARRTASRPTRRFDLIDRYDEKHGISAMMRTTGYSLSITGQMQARGQVKPAGCVDARRVHAGRGVHRRAAGARDGS